MKIRIEQAKLLNALQTVSRAAAPVGGNMPVLNCVLVEANGEGLEFKCTNLDVEISAKTVAEITWCGGIAVPCRLFLELVSNLPKDATVQIESVDKFVSIVSIPGTRFSAEIRGFDPQDYPVLEQQADDDRGVFSVIEASVLADAIKKVSWSAADRPESPMLGAIMMRFQANLLTLVSVSGVTLARTEIKPSSYEEGDDAFDLTFTPPQKELAMLLPLLKGENIGVWTNEKHTRLFFGNKEFCFSTVLITGNFPNYEKLFNSLNETIRTAVTVLRDELLSQLKIIRLFVQDTKQKIVRLDITKDRVSLENYNTESGGSVTEIIYDGFVGEPATMLLNVEQLVNAVTPIADRLVTLIISKQALSVSDTSGYRGVAMNMVLNTQVITNA